MQNENSRDPGRWTVVMALLFTLISFRVTVTAQAEVTPEQLKERGVLLYVPFDGTTKAAFAMGQAEPWVERDLQYTAGVFGEGVQLFCKSSRYVMMPSGRFVKYKNGQSILVYEGLGNLYSRRGTLAFWVLSPFDASNKDLLTGSSLSGPSVIGIAARDVYPAFFQMGRRKSFFEFRFEGTHRSGKLSRFGTFGQKLIPRWKKDYWHHVAVTWDDRRGFAVYHNGEVIGKYEGDIVWDLLEPDTIALGSRPLRARDLWSVNGEYAFDELVTFCRPLSQEEVVKVKDGKYSELRLIKPEDWSFDADTRRRRLNLGKAEGRPVVEATAESGAMITIRQWAVDEVKMNFHRRFKLVDGSETSSVQFSDGGVPFDLPVRFCFSQPSRINHLVTVVGSPNKTYAFEGTPEERLADIPEDRAHVTVADRERREFGIFFKGNSVGREISFFDVRSGAVTSKRGKLLHLSGTVEADQFDDASQVLLRSLSPGDQPALYATAVSAPSQQKLRREAMRHTFIVLEAAEKDLFVDTVRLTMTIKPAKKKFEAVVRVHDPLIPGRVALDMDLTFKCPAADEPMPVDLTLRPPGVVVPAGGHLVLDLILDTDFELEYGKGMGALVEIIEGDPKRVGREFAQAQLRKMWPGFGRRLNQNRFMQRGEEKEKNPIWHGLTLAEKYDPENKQVKAWFGWSRLRLWPKYDFGYLEKQAGPRWAVYLREATLSMQAVIHWWLDNRSNENAYLVGGGNQWNDITKLYNKYLLLGGVAGDTRLVDAVERYLDAHWNTGRMVNGYTYSLTDMTHSAEEANFIQPCFHVLRPGVPRHVYRDLLTASNYSKWIGKNTYGHTHFRSNFINANRMLTEGVHGRDHCGCETPTVPGRFLWWYNGHPPTAKILTDYTDSWLEDTLRATKEKPAGVVPSAVQFETDKLFHGYSSKTLIYDKFLALYQFTGDKKYLKPIQMLLRQAEAIGGLKWDLTYSMNFIQYRAMTGDPTFDKVLRELAVPRYESFAKDGWHARGIEYGEGQALCRWVVDHSEDDLLEALKYVIRCNRRSFFIYCQSDPPTDRVYPWGRVILPVVALGGRLFDNRAADPLPTAAFVWEGIDTDTVSMVFERTPESLKMLVYNFKAKPVEAGLRALQLPEGRYRLAVAMDADGDSKPDGKPAAREVYLRRFTPTPITIPSRKALRVEMSLLEPRPKKLRPDLAVTLAKPIGDNGKIVARAHNLGCAAASNVVVRLLDGTGRKVAEVDVERLSGMTGYKPQFEDVTLALPSGADAESCRLVVDPENAIDEINESNNEYRLSRGVPPPVESAPKKK